MIQELIDELMGHGTDVRITTFMRDQKAMCRVELTLHELGGPRYYHEEGRAWEIEKTIRAAWEKEKEANSILKDVYMPVNV